MSIKLGYEQARDLLELAVEERGSDYVYQQVRMGDTTDCAYFSYAGPSCIVGWVLNRMGMRFSCEETANTSTVHFLRKNGLLDCDDRTLALLAVAQAAQDDNVPWGLAVKLGVLGAETSACTGADSNFVTEIFIKAKASLPSYAWDYAKAEAYVDQKIKELTEERQLIVQSSEVAELVDA